MRDTNDTPLYEAVLTLTEYFDGPRKGIANFRGKPHLYESLGTDIDSDEEDTFLLTPLPEDVVAKALEDWGIWLRWERARHLARYTTIGTQLFRKTANAINNLKRS